MTSQTSTGAFSLGRPSAHHASAAGTIKAYLIGPRADSLMIGGASILVFLAFWFFVDSGAPTTNVAFMAFLLAFLVNSPHFASSYQLLYGDYRDQIFRKKSFFWAAVLSPLLIAGLIFYGITTFNHEVLAFLAQTMYLTVGWHYVKQIFGVSLITSAVQKRYFTVFERNVALMNLYSVWAMSWVNTNLDTRKLDLDGIGYFSLGLPGELMTAVYAITVLTLLATIAVMVRKYIKTGVRPATSSIVGFFTIYIWYIPAFSHPAFFYVIPFFHSLQYLLFVYTIKKNQADANARKESSPVASRMTFVRTLFGFAALAIILGALGFEYVPKNLDRFYRFTGMDGGFRNPTMWYFAIALFINLHHYFIDNVIWRGDNEFLKENLVKANQAKVAL